MEEKKVEPRKIKLAKRKEPTKKLEPPKKEEPAKKEEPTKKEKMPPTPLSNYGWRPVYIDDNWVPHIQEVTPEEQLRINTLFLPQPHLLNETITTEYQARLAGMLKKNEEEQQKKKEKQVKIKIALPKKEVRPAFLPSDDDDEYDVLEVDVDGPSCSNSSSKY